MIEIRSRGVGVNNKYRNISIKARDTPVSIVVLDSEEVTDLCRNLEGFLLDMGHKTAREKRLEKLLTEIYEMSEDNSSGTPESNILWVIRGRVGDVL